MDDLADSALVGPWRERVHVFVCPPPKDASDPCECGYDGPWERGEVLIWHDHPGFNRGDRAVRRDIAGSGTTLQVASGHGLDAIGIDLDSRNAELAYERIGGLFLEVETLHPQTTA